MNRGWCFRLINVGVVAGLLGCGTSDRARLVISDPVGELALPLITPNLGTFRLRQAIFDVVNQSGQDVARLDSEVDPNAAELRVSLAQGSYLITLEQGWALERLADDGSASPVRAALLTNNPLDFRITDGELTRIVYAFTTDEGVVRLGAGEASVSVVVTPPEALPGCSLLDSFSCGFDKTCLLADGTGRTFCAEPGELPVGSACSSEQCVAGAQCLTLEGDSPESGVCRQFCDVAFPPFGCQCQSLDIDANVGICSGSAPPPGDIPTQCTQGVDPGPEGSRWTVCAADEQTAWVSADFEGFYHVDQICQSLGYERMSQFGGTCGNVCGYCQEPTSCDAPGERFFDGSGECGFDELGLQLCLTVMWECARGDVGPGPFPADAGAARASNDSAQPR